jgi:hypothetical protein
MDWKKASLAFVVVLVLANVTGFLVHGMLLQPDYRSMPQLQRSLEEQQAHMPFMLFGSVVYSLAFVWIFARGVEAKPWLEQGVRYGVAVWMISSIPTYLTYYTVQPWPENLVMKQIGFDLVSVVLLGVVAAAIYRKDAATEPLVKTAAAGK